MQGYIRKRGESKWQIEVDLGKSPEGKRLKKVETISGTKKEAQARLSEIIYQINNNMFIKPEKMTVKEFFEYWEKAYMIPNLQKTTLDSYRVIIGHHIIPEIGKIKLQKLLPIHIQEYYTKMLKEGRHDGKGGLSAKTVLYHHRVI